jgi:hypothetical protein
MGGTGFWVGWLVVTLGSTGTCTRGFGYGFYPHSTTNNRPRGLRRTSIDVAIWCAWWEMGDLHARDEMGTR